jgi:hypothetical protein
MKDSQGVDGLLNARKWVAVRHIKLSAGGTAARQDWCHWEPGMCEVNAW